MLVVFAMNFDIELSSIHSSIKICSLTAILPEKKTNTMLAFKMNDILSAIVDAIKNQDNKSKHRVSFSEGKHC